MAELACSYCARPFVYPGPQHRRQLRIGQTRFYCGRKCAGLGRRAGKSKEQRVAEKAAYDREYREKNRARLKRMRAEYFQRTYDPEKARIERASKMAAHVEYCRRYYADPARKAAKVAYDATRRSGKYGPFADAHRLLVELNRELIRRSPDKYERLKARGYYLRGAQTRKRNAQVSRW